MKLLSRHEAGSPGSQLGQLARVSRLNPGEPLKRVSRLKMYKKSSRHTFLSIYLHF